MAALVCKTKHEIFHLSKPQVRPTRPTPPSHLPGPPAERRLGEATRSVVSLPRGCLCRRWVTLGLLGDAACSALILLLPVAREWALILQETVAAIVTWQWAPVTQFGDKVEIALKNTLIYMSLSKRQHRPFWNAYFLHLNVGLVPSEPTSGPFWISDLPRQPLCPGWLWALRTVWLWVLLTRQPLFTFFSFFLGEKSKPHRQSISKHKPKETGFPGFKQMVFTHNLFPRSHLETIVIFTRKYLEA